MRATNVKNNRFILVLACASFLLSSTHVFAEETHTLAATIFPIADIAREISGSRSRVITVIPAGANPHTFEFSPNHVRRLSEVEMLFVVGHHFDRWINTTLRALPNIEIIEVGTGIKARAGDAHYWLSLTNAKVIARNITEQLKTHDAEGAALYDRNLKRYLSELDQAAGEIKSLLSDLEIKKLLTAHDAWHYLAEDYGLQVAGALYGAHGRAPTPRSLARLADIVQSEKIQTLFIEPTMSKTVAQAFAEDFALSLEELDPIGGVSGRETYLDLMKFNAHVIHRALSYD